jgi:probable F420-dependent oxidoreductase
MTLPELGRIGLWTSALDTLPLAEAQRAVAAIEEQGWGALWFGEAYGREAMTAAQLYLSATDRLVIATGIASIYARDAVATAGAARTLSAVSGNRFVLGLGVSHAPLVERMRGHAYGKPIQAMREYLAAMDAAPYAVAGDESPAPRVVAALGPKMLELARDQAQGAHPYLVTPQHTAEARALLGPGPVLAVEQAVVLSDDVAEWARRAHWHLEIYTGLPNYRNSWLRQGFAEGDLVRGGSLVLKQGMVMRGVEQIQAQVQQHLSAGASQVCLQVLGPDTFTAPVDDWRALAGVLLR